MILTCLVPANPGWQNATGASHEVIPEAFPNVRYSQMLFRELVFCFVQGKADQNGTKKAKFIDLFCVLKVLN